MFIAFVPIFAIWEIDNLFGRGQALLPFPLWRQRQK